MLARKLERDPGPGPLREFLRIWRDEMDDRFFEEERVLLEFATPHQSARLINDHMIIRQYATAAQRGMLDGADTVRLGGLIHDHIRWEERALFPAIEESATPEDLDALAALTAQLEERRRKGV